MTIKTNNKYYTILLIPLFITILYLILKDNLDLNNTIIKAIVKILITAVFLTIPIILWNMKKKRISDKEKKRRELRIKSPKKEGVEDEKTILEWMNLEIEDKNKPQVFIKKVSQMFRTFYKSKNGKDFPIGFADQHLLEDLNHYTNKEYKDMKNEFTYYAWRSYNDGGFTKDLSNAEPWCETYKRNLRMQTTIKLALGLRYYSTRILVSGQL